MNDNDGRSPGMSIDRTMPGPKHSLGQNFLRNNSIARRIVDTIPKGTRTVIEIGPGLGILTGPIVERGYSLLAYEIDTRYSSILKEKFGGLANVEIVNDDAMKMIDGETLRQGNYLVSNLPFNISSAIIGRMLDLTKYPFEDGYGFCGATLMFQKEFAERMLSNPGSRTYSRLSVSFQSKLQGRVIAEVDRRDFYPEPEVDALVMVIEERKDPLVSISDTCLFERIVNASFAQRRKQLKNTLISLGIERSMVLRSLAEEGFTSKRPEVLSVEDFIKLSNSLHSICIGNR
jgi:16S rRNA (adenine1518-N6/adenine1519-N6)-dimethyltransferase